MKIIVHQHQSNLTMPWHIEYNSDAEVSETVYCKTTTNYRVFNKTVEIDRFMATLCPWVFVDSCPSCGASGLAPVQWLEGEW